MSKDGGGEEMGGSASNVVFLEFGRRPRDWECTACGRRHHAVAMPYGRCTYCGGEVALLNELEQRGDTLEEAVKDAFELELGGVAFYRRGAELADDPETKALFERLAELEGQHLRRLYFRHKIPVPESTADGVSLAQMVVFGSAGDPPRDRRSLVELAVSIEEMAESFLLERRERFRVGSAGWELYTEMAAEEAEHAAMLREFLEPS